MISGKRWMNPKKKKVRTLPGWPGPPVFFALLDAAATPENGLVASTVVFCSE